MGHHFKPFDSADWDTFNGAEPFPNGDQPESCYMANGAVVVVAAGGFTVVYDDESWVVPAQFHSAKAARRFGAGLLGDLECPLTELGARLADYDAIQF